MQISDRSRFLTRQIYFEIYCCELQAFSDKLIFHIAFMWNVSFFCYICKRFIFMKGSVLYVYKMNSAGGVKNAT